MHEERQALAAKQSSEHMGHGLWHSLPMKAKSGKDLWEYYLVNSQRNAIPSEVEPTKTRWTKSVRIAEMPGLLNTARQGLVV